MSEVRGLGIVVWKDRGPDYNLLEKSTERDYSYLSYDKGFLPKGHPFIRPINFFYACWDPLSLTGRPLVQISLPGDQNWQLLERYIIGVPEDFRRKWADRGYKVPSEIHAPAGFVHDFRSSPPGVKAVLKRRGWGSPPALGHDVLYRLQPEGWTRRIADDFYFYHYKLVIQYNNLSNVLGWPRQTRLGQWFSRSKSWAGVRAGGWAAWNNNRKRLIEAGYNPEPEPFLKA